MFLSTNSSLQSISAPPSYRPEVNEKEFWENYFSCKFGRCISTITGKKTKQPEIYRK